MLKDILQKIARKIESKMPKGVQVKGTQNCIEVYAEDYKTFRDQGVDGTKTKYSKPKKLIQIKGRKNFPGPLLLSISKKN